MYASLDSVDRTLGLRAGRSCVVQRDERLPEEIACDPALSVLFALLRCLNPLRAPEPCAVVYSAAHEPPAFLRAAVVAAGAILRVGPDGDGFLDLEGAPPRFDVSAVNSLANDAMQALAAQALAAAGRDDALQALEAAERAFVASAFAEARDATTLWPAVLRLGALTGAALHLPADAGWVHDATSSGPLPLAYCTRFQGAVTTVDALTTASKFMRQTAALEGPSILVQGIRAFR